MRPALAAVCLLLPLTAVGAPPVSDGAAILRLPAGRVLLAHVEAPPRGALCGADVAEWRCGRIAELAFEQRLQRDEWRCDRPDAGGAVRCVAGGEDLSVWLLDAGWARVAAGAPVQHLAAQDRARLARRGIWRDRTGSWRVPEHTDTEPGCDVCAARHQRVTKTAD